MKRILLFWTILAIVLTVSAQERVTNNNSNDPAQRETHVTPAEALNVGYSFMRTGTSTRGGGTRSSDVSKQTMRLIYTGRTEDSTTHVVTDCYYVFALQPKGFVIVAADNRVNPILGYSYDNNFVVENMPDHVRGWLGHYEKEIEAVAKQNITPESETTTKWSRLRVGQSISTRSGESVGPLLTTTWDQGQYYNSLCPEDANGPDGHVWTGCVATAIAQIINFWGYPSHGRGIHSYNSNYGTLTVNYDSANYDYANMPASLTSDNTAVQVNAVATLMRDCGFALNMDYSAYESGAYDEEVRAVLMNFFKYSPNMSLAEKPLFTDDEWETMLRNDLDAGTPIYYSGQGTGGHAFVCDGYTADGYFSFNFGWGGYFNGWYLTSEISPGDRDYNDYQCAIFGIVPDSTGNVILGQMTGTSTFTVDEPLEFYHLMGHNAYMGLTYNDPCNNTVAFVSKNHESQIVADIIEFEDQNLAIYDGDGTWLRSFYGGGDNDLSPVVSTQHALNLEYQGNFYYTGFKLIVSQDNGCRMVSNIVSSVDATTVLLTWTENGSATQWEVEYGLSGFSIGTGTRQIVPSNAYEITGLQKFTKYDIYIRPICGIDQHGQWNMVKVLTMAPYWTDVVTTQPEGYQIDANGNIEISSAEGMAWFVSVANGLNGMPHDEVQWDEKTVKLTNDIDLSAYRWMPIKYGFCGGVFDGQGHTISGLYAKESDNAGLFSFIQCSNTKVLNLNIENCNINSMYWAGGLAAKIDMASIYNCSVRGVIYGHYLAGGIAAFAADCEIQNCYTDCDITGNIQISGGFMGTGGLIGVLRGVNKNLKLTTLQNCYSSSIVKSPNIKGGLVGYVENSYVHNCYGLFQNNYELFGGQELSTFATNQAFSQVDDFWSLTDSVEINGEKLNNLLEVLNFGVQEINIHGMRLWVSDISHNNLPTFGDTIEVLCENVSDVVARNIIVNGEQAVEVSWADNGMASVWEIRYGIQSEPYIEICDTLFYVNAFSNPDTIYGLSNYNEQTCIINVRPICDSIRHGGWSKNYLLNIDFPYWSDVVTTQPDGYQIDIEGNVQISTAEGLAWLISVVNGENGQEPNNLSGRIVTLVNDVNMSQYKWIPLGIYGGHIESGPLGAFEGKFDGSGHTIFGLRINNSGNYTGMFSLLNNSIIKDLTLDGCNVVGRSYVGGLFGYAERSEIFNCNVKATIQGTHEVGGVAGAIKIASTIDHCSFEGDVYSEQGVCGGIVGSVNNNMSISGIIAGEVLVRNCWTIVNINSNGFYSGGLAGAGMHHCSFNNSYAICNIVSDRYVGGLVGYCYGSEYGYTPKLVNCYSVSSIDEGVNVGRLVGGIEFRTSLSNCYSMEGDIPLIGEQSSLTTVQNVLEYNYVDSLAQFQYPIIVHDSAISNLLDALNYWVQSNNDNIFFTWQYSTNDTQRHPVFGNQLEVDCQSPQIMIDTIWNNGVIIKWNSLDDVQSYEVEYGSWCFEQGTGTLVNLTDTLLTITDLLVGEKYDIYLRSNCGNGYGRWNKITIKPDKLYWKDIVTSQPEGWSQDENGNIYISSPEALAWLITYSEQNLWTSHTIHIMNDIDISRYKWTTFGRYWLNWNFEGNGHTISGLYIDEDQNELAFIHTLYNGYIKDLFFDSCFVRGNAYVSIVCHNNGGSILNCGVRGKVLGHESLGGMTSINSYEAKVSNSYSNCDVIISSFGTSFGGFCAINYGFLNNCYSSSRIIIDSAYYARCQRMGIFTGDDYSNNASDNIAYWRYDPNNGGNNPIYGVSYGSAGYYAFIEDEGTFVVSNPPLIGDSSYYDLIDALNAWVDANNSEGIYCHWAADTANINGGYPVFATIPCVSVTGSDTILACDSYMWHGDVYTTSSELVDSLLTSAGCDSVVTHYLIVNHPLHAAVSEIACESYTWNGTTYTTSGEYTFSHLDANGCTQVDTLHLTINNPVHESVTEIAYDTYEWNGVTYDTTGVYTYEHQDGNGCMQVDTLHLTVYYSSSSDIYATVCESYTWNEEVFTTSGEYERHFLDIHGADSAVTLHLTVNLGTHNATTETVCDSYEWNGALYTESGMYIHEYTNEAGCPSVDTLHLTVNYSTAGIDEQVACESYTWIDGVTYTESTSEPTYTLTNAAGCDSVVTLHLTVTNTDHTDFTDAACDSYAWNGETYTESGTYTQTFTNSAGCDSVVTLHLTIFPSVTSEFSVLTEDSCYIWNNIEYCTSGDYTQTLQTVHGCDSVVTLHLTITVGIDNHKTVDFRVYPNPTNGIVNVDYTMNNVQYGELEIQVVDMYGKLVRIVETQLIASLQRITIDLSDLANGVYFVKAMEDGKVVAVRKVVKN